MDRKTPDFDAHRTSQDGWTPVINFVRDFFDEAAKKNQQKNEEFRRVNKMYRNQMDMSGRDPNKSNMYIPKLYSTVETIVPYCVDALLGVRPFIPIEMTHKKNSAVGAAITDLLDSYFDTPNFYEEMVKLLKYTILFGASFIEARPDYEHRRVVDITEITDVDQFGQETVLGHSKSEEVQTFLKMVYRAYAPWEIYQDPFAKTVDDARGIVKFRGFTSKRQLQKMNERSVAAGRPMFPDLDIEMLAADISETQKDDWCQHIAKSLGATLPVSDDDMGVWLSYESADRYIDLWNFSSVIRDIPNPFAIAQGGHGKINLTRLVNTLDTNPIQSWFGLGEGKPIEQLQDKLNQTWNQTFDNHDMQNEGVIYYDEEAFSVDQLLMIGGNRIPATLNAGRSIGDAIVERKTPGLPRDFYAIPETIEGMIDQTTGQHEITRGETAAKDQTAREAILKRQAGDSRMKLKIKLMEKLGFADFGEKMTGHLEQFATMDDVASRIGVERASGIPSLNPMAIEGGAKYAPKGSDRMADAQIKRQDAKDVYQLMVGNPSVSQEWLAKWALERFEVPEDQMRLAIRADQEALMMAAAQAAAGGAGGAGETTRAVSNGQTVGGGIGYSPTGRDHSEKLSQG